jgi:hypothetical protein
MPSEPPSLLPDDVDEVQNPNPLRPKILWTVQREKNGKTDSIFRAETSVEYRREDDTYTLHALLKATNLARLQEVLVGKVFKIDSISSEYCVDRAGHLHSLKAVVKVTPQFGQLGREVSSLFGPLFSSQPPQQPKISTKSDPVTLRLQGEVRGDQFFAHCDASVAVLSKSLQFDLPPTTVSHSGSVLMPLHPVNHIRGLHLGQTWRQPLVDPLRDAFGISGGVRSLNARVLPQPEVLKLDAYETECLVIEYTNDENEMMGRTWVERDSERVLQQEAILDDGHWIMKRDLERRSGKRFLER